MSELSVGSLSGLAANSYVIDVASGSSLDLSSGAVLPAGSVLQVVESTSTSIVTTTSNTFQSTGLTASITPSATSSKVLVFTSCSFSHASAAASCIATIFRGTTAGTNLGLPGGYGEIYNTNGGLQANINFQVLDSPNTTSSQAYTLAFRSSNTSGTTITAVTNSRTASMVLVEIAG